MGNFDKSKLSPELVQRISECKSEDELIALAKENGVSITTEEAKAYLEELEDIELDEETLGKVAGGLCYMEDCPKYTMADCVY